MAALVESPLVETTKESPEDASPPPEDSSPPPAEATAPELKLDSERPTFALRCEVCN